MRLKVRGPEGSSTVTLEDSNTVEDLRKSITKATSLSAFELKHGFPPKPLDLDAFNDETKLADTGLKLNGEQLIAVPRHIEQLLQHQIKEPPQDPSASDSNASKSSLGGSSGPPAFPPYSLPKSHSSSTTKTNPSNDPPEIPVHTHGGTLVLRVMPDDNSCLFRALGSAFLGPSLDSMHELRSMVASTIQNDPDTYSSAILGQDRDEYCRWIQTDDAWGGAIEMGILSKQFNYEVYSINVKDGRVDRFNEEASVKQRCILVYSGIHFDVIALSPDGALLGAGRQPPEKDQKIFDRGDDKIIEATTVLVDQLRKQHYFTDTAGFSIQCTDCGWRGKGEKEAMQHAQDTKHFNLTEVKD